MLKMRKDAIDRASHARKFGLILGTLGRQGSPQVVSYLQLFGVVLSLVLQFGTIIVFVDSIVSRFAAMGRYAVEQSQVRTKLRAQWQPCLQTRLQNVSQWVWKVYHWKHRMFEGPFKIRSSDFNRFKISVLIGHETTLLQLYGWGPFKIPLGKCQQFRFLGNKLCFNGPFTVHSQCRIYLLE